mmetsp:Transcript_40195/g.45911  ORF Transcript_40195/g.45911 Transcript_40195/m.45911 type:complete len:333 (-) Transcript_40195:29-1027(-)
MSLKPKLGMKKMTNPKIMQREKDETFMSTLRFNILHIRLLLERKNKKGSSKEEIRLLLMKTMATPTNLKALLRMMDADIRIGSMLCDAILIMNELVDNKDLNMWSMMNQFGHHDQQQPFTTKYMKVLGKTLHDEAKTSTRVMHDDEGNVLERHGYAADVSDTRFKCTCLEKGVWQHLSICLELMGGSKEYDPYMVLNILDQFDWTAILEANDAPCLIDPLDNNKRCVDSSVAVSLTMHASNVLLIEKEYTKAWNLLRQVGHYRKLFHRGLKRIIAGDIYSQHPALSVYLLTATELRQEGIALLKCTSCKQIAYCSRDCQKKQWKEHKKTCMK